MNSNDCIDKIMEGTEWIFRVEDVGEEEEKGEFREIQFRVCKVKEGGSC